jgi:hypothetical protein
VESNCGVSGEIANERQDGVRHAGVILECPHILERSAGTSSGHMDGLGTESNAPSRHAIVATEAMEPPVSRMEQPLAHLLPADAGREDMNLADIDGRPALNQEAVQRLGDDLGAEPRDGEEERRIGGRGDRGRRSAPSRAGSASLARAWVVHGSVVRS